MVTRKSNIESNCFKFTTRFNILERRKREPLRDKCGTSLQFLNLKLSQLSTDRTETTKTELESKNLPIGTKTDF